MKRFGSIFPFLEQGRRPAYIGRLGANADFVEALIRYGRYDDYLFGSPSRQNLVEFREAVEAWLPPVREKTVRYADYAEWTGILRETDFHVVHLGGWGHFMPGLHFLRSQLAPRAWPITGIIHSLHGRETVDHAVRLTAAQMHPCDAVFCTSRDGRLALEHLLEGASAIVGRRFAGQLLDVPLGIPDSLVSATDDGVAARQRLRIASDALVVLVLGRLSVTQKMDLGPVCRAFAQYVRPQVVAPVVLVFAGAGSPNELELVQQAAASHGLADHIRFQANFAPVHKPGVLGMADVVLAPSDNVQETFGLSILEAQAAGVPVVASRFDGYKDLVRDGVDGFLIDTWQAPVDMLGSWFDVFDGSTSQLIHSQGIALDLAQLGRRLVELLSNPDLRRTMGEAGRRKMEKTYRWSQVIPQFEDHWNHLAREARQCHLDKTVRNPFSLSPAAVFSHYPSHTLREDTRVQAVDGWSEQPYFDTAGWLARPLIDDVLARARRPTPAGDLVQHTTVPPAHAWFVVAWLLKYGGLVVSSETLQGPRRQADSPR